MNRILFATVACIVLSACNTEKTYTRDDFLNDEALYKKYLERCTNDQGTYGSTPNCINLSAARKIKDANEFESLWGN
jgi:Prokaryotic membrane lipoprotein lipid attachment site